MVLLHWLFQRQLRGDRRFRRPYFSVQDGKLQCLGIKQWSKIFHFVKQFKLAKKHGKISVLSPCTGTQESIRKTQHCTTKTRRSDEGLAFETSAFESLYGGQFTLSTQLIKPNYLMTNAYALVCFKNEIKRSLIKHQKGIL